ncbi:MAG: DUF2190 family protein [Verrucomicrobiota bacterium]
MNRKIWTGIGVGVLVACGIALAAGNYFHTQANMQWTASGNVYSGNVVDLGDKYGIVLVDTTNALPCAVALEGVWNLTLTSNETVTAGAKLYWDSTNSRVTTTATADTYIGTAYSAVTTTTSTGIIPVFLNDSQRQSIVGLDVQAYDADLDALAINNGASLTNIPESSIVGPLAVARGGTGAATLTDGGILLGSGTGAITALGAASNGQIPIGDGTTDPVLATLTGTANEVDISNGAGSITIGIVDEHSGVLDCRPTGRSAWRYWRGYSGRPRRHARQWYRSCFRCGSRHGQSGALRQYGRGPKFPGARCCGHRGGPDFHHEHH